MPTATAVVAAVVAGPPATATPLPPTPEPVEPQPLFGDLDVPTPDGMRAILDRIDASIADGRPVYVHCWGGIGRTGTVVCCWLIERGRTCDEALADICQLREGIQKRMIQSPEADGQREFVRAWVRRRERPDG